VKGDIFVSWDIEKHGDFGYYPKPYCRILSRQQLGFSRLTHLDIAFGLQKR